MDILTSGKRVCQLGYNTSRVLLLAASLLCLFVSCNPKDDPKPEPGPGPEPEEVVSKGAYKHVVIIGVDGAGAFFNNTPTPRLDEIFEGGATTLRCMVGLPTISAQGWGSLLHGVLPEYHGMTNAIAEDRALSYPVKSPFPSIFRLQGGTRSASGSKTGFFR